MFLRMILTKLANKLTSGKPEGYDRVLIRNKKLYIKVYVRNGQSYIAVHKSPDKVWWNYMVLNIDTNIAYDGRYPYRWLH